MNKNKKPRTNFFNSKILQCLHNHKEYINNYLKTSFNEYLELKKISGYFSQDLINLELLKNNKINLFGKVSKAFYIKNENEIFVEFVLDLPEGENHIFGLKILQNGKLFAGKFDEFGSIEGNGIYISRKGDLNIGNFIKNDLPEAIIYCSNGSSYEGKLINLKKHGQMQTEISQHYEFVGDFENGKKIQGIFYPKNEHINEENPNQIHVRSIEINKENLVELKKGIKNRRNDNNEASDNFLTKIIFDYEGEVLIYYGCVKGNKLNDLNAILMFDLEKKFPLFNCAIKNNAKEGRCTYYNSENDFYGGFYSDGNFYSDIEKNAESTEGNENNIN